MPRKTGKRTKGAVGAMPRERSDLPGRRTAPRPLRDRPTPARATARSASPVPAPGVIPAGPTLQVNAAITPALYARLRRYADDSRSTVEGTVIAAIEGFLDARRY